MPSHHLAPVLSAAARRTASLLSRQDDVEPQPGASAAAPSPSDDDLDDVHGVGDRKINPDDNYRIWSGTWQTSHDGVHELEPLVSIVPNKPGLYYPGYSVSYMGGDGPDYWGKPVSTFAEAQQGALASISAWMDENGFTYWPEPIFPDEPCAEAARQANTEAAVTRDPPWYTEEQEEDSAPMRMSGS